MGGISQGNDVTFMFLPWWRFAIDAVSQGTLPLWNPYLSSGSPFIANPQPALFYPPIWFLSVLAPTRIVGFLLVSHLWLAGWGMYVWLRSEGASFSGAILGASIFAFSGYFFVRGYAGHIGVVMTQAWLPWILWMVRNAMAQRRWPWIVLGGVPVGLALLAGHTASFLYVGGVFALYALYTAWRNGDYTLLGVKAALWPPVGMLGVGLGIAAVQLVPTFQFLALSTRQQVSYAFSANYSWPPGYLLTLLIPNFFGDAITTGYWGDGMYEELIFYVGVLPLILALFPLVQSDDQQHSILMGRYSLIPGLLALTMLGLLLAMGRFSIVHRLAYTIVPLFQATRAPARAGFVFTVAVAALAGIVITHIARAPRKMLRNPGWGATGWGVGIIATLVILTGFMLFTLQRDSNPEVGRLWHVANNTALFLFFFTLAVALLSAWRRERITGNQGAILALLLVLIDLWSFGRPLLQPVPATDNHFWTQVSDLIMHEEDDLTSIEQIKQVGRILPWGLNIFEQNQGMRLGLESVFAYDPLEIRRYHRFTTYVEDPRARAYDLLRTRYLAATQEVHYPEDPDAFRLLGSQNGVWLYERPHAFPAAWMVHNVEIQENDASLLARLNDPTFDPRHAALLNHRPVCELGEASVLSRSGDAGQTEHTDRVEVVHRYHNRLDFQVQSEAGGLLVLSEVMYPGWHASVDGERTPILQADYVLRAICVPPGTHQVSFYFRPGALWIGTGITLLTGLLIAWVGFTHWRYMRGSKN